MSPTPIEFSRTHSQTILGQSFNGVNPTYSRLVFEFLFSLTSCEGQRVRVAIKIDSFCIIEISLSPTFQFVYSRLTALVATSASLHFHFKPIADLVPYPLATESIKYVSNFTHSILHRGIGIPCYFIDGRYYPESVRRTAVLSCDSNGLIQR